MKHRPWLVVAALLSIEARAQNLIPNPSFSELFMLDGWTIDGASDADWSSVDAGEVANSGSIRIASVDANTARGITSICMPVEENIRYRVAASALWLDAESSAGGRVHARLDFLPTTNCSGLGFAGGTSAIHVDPDDWQRIEALVDSPEGAQSAEVNLWVWKDSGAGAFAAYFDDVELIALPEPEAASAGFGALAAIASIARRAARHALPSLASRRTG